MIEHCQIEALLCFLSDDSDFILTRWRGPITTSGECKAKVHKTPREESSYTQTLKLEGFKQRRQHAEEVKGKDGGNIQKSSNSKQLTFSVCYFLNHHMVMSCRPLHKNFKSRKRFARSKNKDCYELRQLDAHRGMLFCALAHTKHHNLISFGKP